MLILTRKIGEHLLIGGDIRITILEIRGKQIRLGIDAPPHVVILREEIYQRLQDQPPQEAGVQNPEVKKVAGIWKGKKEDNPA